MISQVGDGEVGGLLDGGSEALRRQAGCPQSGSAVAETFDCGGQAGFGERDRV